MFVRSIERNIQSCGVLIWSGWVPCSRNEGGLIRPPAARCDHPTILHALLVHYDARRRRGEPIATSFVESAVDEIIAWRIAKAQQMRWSRATVQPFLDVRTAVLNDTLEGAFRWRHPGFRPTNDDQALPATA